MTCRLFIATLSVIACVACERSTPEKDASIETPYAARFATQKPAFVRTAAAATHDMTRPVETFADPQYTAAQSAAGADVYKATCARCHAPTQWKGGTFAAAWQDRRLSDFYDLVSVTMPLQARVVAAITEGRPLLGRPFFFRRHPKVTSVLIECFSSAATR